MAMIRKRRIRNIMVRLMQDAYGLIDRCDTVRAGALAGMPYVGRSLGSSRLPKIYGTYEREVQEFFARSIRESDSFCNIGCADGYYLLGAKWLNPNIHVTGVDVSARALTSAASRLSAYDGVTLIQLDPDNPDMDALPVADFYMLDCEGFEYELVRSTRFQHLIHSATLIIEDHWFKRSAAHAGELERHLRDSHQIERRRTKADFGFSGWKYSERRHPDASYLLCIPSSGLPSD